MKVFKTSRLCKTLLMLLISIFMFSLFPGSKENIDLTGFTPILMPSALAKENDRKDKYFTLNFKDADITEFLNVMGQLIGKNIIIDDKVRGKITISSVKKFPVSQAYQILKSILEVKGLAVVETPTLIKIIPLKEAIKKNVDFRPPGH